MLRIGIDIDDTITNTIDLLLEKAAYFDKYILNDKGFQDKDAFDFKEMYYWTDDDKTAFFQYLKNNDYLEEVEIKKDFLDNYEEISKKCEIIFITARNERAFKDSEKQTKAYLEKYNIKYNKLYVKAKNKDEICEKEKIDLFIDDNENIVESVQKKGIKTILMKSMYNNDSKLFLLNNWYEINEYIDSLIHNN